MDQDADFCKPAIHNPFRNCDMSHNDSYETLMDRTYLRLGPTLFALLLSLYVCSVDAAAEENRVAVDRIKWAVYDTAPSGHVSSGVHEKTLQASDFKIRQIGRTMFDKEIELGDHFSFGLADSIDSAKPAQGAKTTDGRATDENGYVLKKDESKKSDD
jgi:hypothetical protein